MGTPISRASLDRTEAEMRKLFRGGDGLTAELRDQCRAALDDIAYFPHTSRETVDVVEDGQTIRMIVAAPRIRAVLRELRRVRNVRP